MHLLQHLVHYVEQYGPLWRHSCFAFEGLNGRLLKLYHGTQHVGLQASMHVYMYMYLHCSYNSVHVYVCVGTCMINYVQIVKNWDALQKVDNSLESDAYTCAPADAQDLLGHLTGQEQRYAYMHI